MAETFTILCVDDDEDTLFITRLSLELDPGIVVVTALGGARALDVLTRGDRTFDCILLDVHMPALSGPDLLSRIRALPGRAALPVVFLTASVRAHDLRHYREVGATGMIAKPFDPLTLASQVRRIVRAP